MNDRDIKTDNHFEANPVHLAQHYSMQQQQPFACSPPPPTFDVYASTASRHASLHAPVFLDRKSVSTSSKRRRSSPTTSFLPSKNPLGTLPCTPPGTKDSRRGGGLGEHGVIDDSEDGVSLVGARANQSCVAQTQTTQTVHRCADALASSACGLYAPPSCALR